MRKCSSLILSLSLTATHARKYNFGPVVVSCRCLAHRKPRDAVVCSPTNSIPSKTVELLLKEEETLCTHF
jgi:hypothetical protein